MHFGPNDILVTVSLDFRDDVTLAEIEQTVSRLERNIRDRFPGIGRVFIETQSREDHDALRGPCRPAWPRTGRTAASRM